MPKRRLPKLLPAEPPEHDDAPAFEPPDDYLAVEDEPTLEDCLCGALPAHGVEDCPAGRVGEEEARYAAHVRHQDLVPGDHQDLVPERRPEVALRLAQLRARLLSTPDLIDLPAPRFLIDGVLVQNTLAVLWGKPGANKSFVAVDWAMSLGSGSWWTGRAVSEGTHRVLYLAGEGGAGLGRRADAWLEDRSIHTSPNVEWLPGSVNLLDRGWAEAAVALAVEMEPVLVVVDTLARAMSGGDENSTRDMGVLIDVAGAIQQQTSSSVLLVHHDTKAGGTMRGSSALLGAVDTSIECRADGRAVTLRCEKQKDAEPFEPIRLWRHNVGESCVLHSHLGVGVTAELTAAQDHLRRVAWECCGSDGLSASRLREVADQASSTFYRALKVLVSTGELVNVGTEKQPRYRPPQGVQG